MSQKHNATTNNNDDTSVASEKPLIAHLLELRSRLLRIVIGVLVILIPLAIFSGDLYSLLAEPLMAQLPEGASLIATGVAAPFLAPFKLALVAAIAVSLPWTLYQVWMFIAPGLYAQELRVMTPLLITSTLLFYLGMAFAYFVIFPVVFSFFVNVAPAGVQVATDISAYLDFVLGLFVAFGLAFELPVALYLLVWAGIVTPSKLRSVRAYVLVGAFGIGMLLTPPDIISQTLLAVPIYLLYEIGVFVSVHLVPDMREVEAQRREQNKSKK